MIKILESEDKRSKLFVIPEDTETTQEEYMTSYGLDNDSLVEQKRVVKALEADPKDLYIITPDSYEGDQSSLEQLANAYLKHGRTIPGTSYKLYIHHGNRVAIIYSEGSFGMVATKQSFENISNAYNKIQGK